MEIRLSIKAKDDLAHIFDYGRKEFVDLVATNYLAKLRHSMSLIEQHPHIASLQPELGDNIRLHAIGTHVILYTITELHILIIRILRAEQNWVDHL